MMLYRFVSYLYLYCFCKGSSTMLFNVLVLLTPAGFFASFVSIRLVPLRVHTLSFSSSPAVTDST